MSRLTPTAGLIAVALFLATGTWWLANTAMQTNSGFVGVPIVSAQAAFALVLGQWLLIGLFATQEDAGTFAGAAAVALSGVLPLWPLFALLWLTSNLSVATLAATQVIAVLLAVAMTVIGAGIERMRIDGEMRMMLRMTAGIVTAALVWTGRGQLHTWVTA